MRVSDFGVVQRGGEDWHLHAFVLRWDALDLRRQ